MSKKDEMNEEIEEAINAEKSLIKIFEFKKGSIGYYQMYSMIDLIEKLQKIINKMAEDLTTPIHDKEWIIDHYLKEIEKDEN